MSLLISYQDATGKAVYANLFSASNKLKAFNPSTHDFETISLAYQSDFAIVLSENLIRKGYYSYSIANTENIPPTDNGDFYLVEVFEALGSGNDRESDTLLGTMAFYWDGEKEVDICGCQTQLGTSLTAQDVWEYSNRGLTDTVDCGDIKATDVNIDLECPDPYIIVNADIEGINDLKDDIKNAELKIDEIIRLINNMSPSQPDRTTSIPKTSNPTIGPRGSSGGSSSIRVR